MEKFFINKEAEEYAKHVQNNAKQMLSTIESIYNKACADMSNTPKFLTINWKTLQALDIGFQFECYNETNFVRHEDYSITYKDTTLVRVDPTLVDGVIFFSQT